MQHTDPYKGSNLQTSDREVRAVLLGHKAIKL